VGPVIATVTCNPAIDVTYRLPRVRPGDVHRVDEVVIRPGGKSVNVARVLQALGEDVIATGLGDATFGAQVAGLGVRASFLDLLPAVRRTVVLHDDESTSSFWEAGAAVEPWAATALEDLVTSLLPTLSALVVSGSLPPGLDPSLPARLAVLASDAGVPVVLDLDDVPLAEAARCGRAVLTPNLDELARLLGPVDDLVAAAHQLAATTGAPVVLTAGARGLVATDGTTCWRAVGPVVSGNPTGAGDAAVAGIARGLAHGHDWPRTLVHAAALGAAAVLAPVAGEIDPARYAELLDSVRLEHVRSLPMED
jgi:tagatose 6-phosphate kinase